MLFGRVPPGENIFRHFTDHRNLKIALGKGATGQHTAGFQFTFANMTAAHHRRLYSPESTLTLHTPQPPPRQPSRIPFLPSRAMPWRTDSFSRQSQASSCSVRVTRKLAIALPLFAGIHFRFSDSAGGGSGNIPILRFN